MSESVDPPQALGPANPTPCPACELAEVLFLSQAWAEAYLPRPGEAIISITDRGAPQANLNEGWTAVLRVSFDDVDPLETEREPDDALIELQVHEAERIAGFVRNHRHQVGTLVVHCRFGQSRSAGVAKAVAKAYGLHFPNGYRYANSFVHQLVLDALQRQGDAMSQKD